MDRRTFLKTTAKAGALTATGFLATPAISQRAATRALRLVPHADLSNFDPIWSFAYVARNAGVLVWDMLYGMDAKLQPQRQMVESEEVSSDSLTWTFRLRPGLKFHDGEPVRASDAVASISRWSAREPMGAMIKAIENELVAIDDRTFRWVLKKPYPKMLLALGKIGPPCCFVMPARIAATDPFKQINEHVGSGPLRFVRNEWVPGARAAFERFPDYIPRPEPASWLAGGKRIVADRIEWVTMPDPATAAAALQNGEIDWWEVVIPDLVPVLRKNRNVMVDINDPMGVIGCLLMNHLFPPFNDVRARRAILMALSQEDYMRAYVGEPVICMAAQDQPLHKAWGDVTVDLLQRLGMNVDYAAVDFGTVVARRAQKSPPGQGGWQMYVTSYYGVEAIDPTNRMIRSNGELALNGWSTNAAVEAEVAAWYAATSLDEEKAIARRLNKAAFDQVVFAPLGMHLRRFAHRKNVTGIAQGPLPFFWGVGKTV